MDSSFCDRFRLDFRFDDLSRSPRTSGETDCKRKPKLRFKHTIHREQTNRISTHHRSTAARRRWNWSDSSCRRSSRRPKVGLIDCGWTTPRWRKVYRWQAKVVHISGGCGTIFVSSWMDDCLDRIGVGRGKLVGRWVVVVGLGLFLCK